MGVEIKPLGAACNLRCRYCYQNPMREAGTPRIPFDLEKVKRAAERHGEPLTLFGGEPLLLPLPGLEELLRWSHERHGRSSIQTNGTLAGDAHLRLFEQYNVAVGISIDGPGELNDLRLASSLEETRAATLKVERLIARLCEAGRPPSLILTLHRLNGAAASWPRMAAWLAQLERLGVRRMRLHLLEVDDPAIRRDYALDAQENIAALRRFAQWESRPSLLRFDLFSDMRNLLLGRDGGTACVWNACDPYNTQAVRGIEGNGQSSNCGRTNKDGTDYLKARGHGFERYRALASTPQDQGGCQDCRFFFACKGQCPGTALQGDWRNRTEHCEVWKQLYTDIEQHLLEAGTTPLSVSRAGLLERALTERWRKGSSLRLRETRGVLTSTTPAPSPSPDATPTGLGRFSRLAWSSAKNEEMWAGRLAAIRGSLSRAAPEVARRLDRPVWSQIESGRYFEVHQRCSALDLRSLDLTDRGGALSLPGEGLRLAAAVSAPVYARLAALIKAGDGLELLQQAGIIRAGSDAPGRIRVPDNWKNNVWLAPLGVSLHPAGLDFDVSGADAIIAARRAVLEEQGAARELAWMEELLSGPMELSMLHGIAEVKTPYFKFCYNTVRSRVKHAWRVGS